MVTTKWEIVLNLTNQHKLGVLQRIIIQQRIQFCPLCGAWQYLLIKDQRGRPLYFNTEADDRIDFFTRWGLFFLFSHLTALPCITAIDDDIHVGAVHQVFQDAKLLFGTSRHQIFIIYLFVLRSTAI